jgi:hypothetical protein
MVIGNRKSVEKDVNAENAAVLQLQQKTIFFRIYL